MITDSPERVTRELLLAGSLLLVSIGLLEPLFGDRVLTYLDNPVHLAELEELVAHGYGSWSELAFCGFPLSLLHSPLWYGLLTLLGDLGIPILGLYIGALVSGSAATPLAIYFVGRRRATPLVAWLVAYLYLILPTNTVGFSSAAGGMWTFHLGTALLVLLADVVVSGPESRRRLVKIAGLLALIGLTHHFVLVAAALVCAAGLAIHGVRRSGPFSTLVKDVPCWAIAALASLIYWGPTLIANGPTDAGSQNLSVASLWLRLLVPTDLLKLLPGSTTDPLRYDLALSESLAPLGLFALAGSSLWRDRGSRFSKFLVLGCFLVLASLALLMLAPRYPLFFLGPVSWRFVTFVHLGLVLMAISEPTNRRSRGRYASAPAPPVRRVLLLSGLAVASAFWWNRPLIASAHPDARRDLEDLRLTWAWLSANADPHWSRIYVQDTFVGTREESLGMGHVSSLTRHNTGLRQIGSYYGVHPFVVGRWTASEGRRLFAHPAPSPQQLTIRAGLSATDVLLLSFSEFRERVAATMEFDEIFRKGRFSVWRRREAPAPWALSLDPSTRILATRYDQETVELTVDSGPTGGAVLTAISYHPWWRLSGPKGVEVVEHETGLVNLRQIPPGLQRIVLRWEPERRWLVGSGVGWCLWIALWLRARHETAEEVDV